MIRNNAFRRLTLNSRRSLNPCRAVSRFYASTAEAAATSQPASPSVPRTRREQLLKRIHARVPTWLHPYTAKLVNAPVTHLTSFLILHEITALVPLLGLAGFFHYSNWLPKSISEWKWASDGIGHYAHYFRKKGWLKEVEKDENGNAKGGYWDGMGDGRFKVILELATAYAITKTLLPVRLGLCFYGTPWFARTAIEPFTSLFRKALANRKV